MPFNTRISPRRAILLASLLATSAVPGLSHAARCGGMNINNLLAWDEAEIAKGTTMATMRFTSVLYSDDPKVPYHLASGECNGIHLAGPDGARQSGFCARRDKDGDVLYEAWDSTDGEGNRGTARNIGGTGKYAKASGAMQWEFAPLQGKMGAVRWSGDCQ